MDNQAQQILSKYKENIYSPYLEDLKTLMLCEGIKGIAYRTYTPQYNDGDVCYPAVEFIAPIYSYTDQGYLLIYGDQLVCTENPQDYTDEFNFYIPKDHAELMKSTNHLYSLTHEYKTEGLEEFLYNFATNVLSTNEEGYILSTGKWHRKEYQHDDY